MSNDMSPSKFDKSNKNLPFRRGVLYMNIYIMKELFTESGVMKNEKDKKNIKRNYPFIMVYALLL